MIAALLRYECSLVDDTCGDATYEGTQMLALQVPLSLEAAVLSVLLSFDRS